MRIRIQKQIKGTRSNGSIVWETPIVVRISDDAIGKTLSMSVETGIFPVQLAIPLEPLLRDLREILENQKGE